MRRVIYVILDGVGIGELPDADSYGDRGSDTLGNLSRVVDLDLPFLRRLGLGNIAPLRGVAPVDDPLGLVGRLAPHSVGKDSTVGHWEQMGLVTEGAFPTYPDGFPSDIMSEFARLIGREALGNMAASGTEIIATLGSEHLRTGRPIVYTSADSVFQVAAHIDVVPLEELYSWCEVARSLLVGRHAVARVIARPFAGREGAYARTPDRRDFTVPPPGVTYLDLLRASGVSVTALGKIYELFAGKGIGRTVKVKSNRDNLERLAQAVGDRSTPISEPALVITNLVDFDTVWGHRNDVDGFAEGLREADRALDGIAGTMQPEDLLVITADHGVDPTTESTDHSREYVPLLIYPRPTTAPSAVYEGDFADVGATAFEYLTSEDPPLEGRCAFGLRPSRGWQAFTPCLGGTLPELSRRGVKVGSVERAAAGRWLRENLGDPPDVAVILGSGIQAPVAWESEADVAYDSVPGWKAGRVEGHAYKLTVTRRDGTRYAFLGGRVHEYEGYDLSEIQLPVRSMAAWGVRRLVLISAAGGVAKGVCTGDVVVADTVLDFQYRALDGTPIVLPATCEKVLESVTAAIATGDLHVARGSHASVPGPQYETPAELGMLRIAGVRTVSMSPAGEVRAALDENLETVVLALVTNSGETTHSQVIEQAASAGERVGAVLRTLALSLA